MKIQVELNVSASFVYGRIIDSVLHDIVTNTGEHLGEKELIGFVYEKLIGNIGVTIEIDQVEQDSMYQFTTKSTRNQFSTLYEIMELETNKCLVTYTETVQSLGTIQTANDKIVSAVFRFFKKRRVKKLLQAIASSVGEAPTGEYQLNN